MLSYSVSHKEEYPEIKLFQVAVIVLSGSEMEVG
jgi:hypothetical protein